MSLTNCVFILECLEVSFFDYCIHGLDIIAWSCSFCHIVNAQWCYLVFSMFLFSIIICLLLFLFYAYILRMFSISLIWLRRSLSTWHWSADFPLNPKHITFTVFLISKVPPPYHLDQAFVQIRWGVPIFSYFSWLLSISCWSFLILYELDLLWLEAAFINCTVGDQLRIVIWCNLYLVWLV